MDELKKIRCLLGLWTHNTVSTKHAHKPEFDAPQNNEFKLKDAPLLRLVAPKK
jgi:hypothetical protein